MASGERDASSDDAGDDADVTGEVTETTAQTDKGAKASPWMIAKVHHKVKKHAGKASNNKRGGAGGGKTKKKGASKTRRESQQDGADADDSSATARPAPTSPTGSDADSSQHDPSTDAHNAKASCAPQETLDAIYDDEVSPTVNGMRQFGISKGVISRAIVRFSSPPEPHPLTVCFHFPGTFLSHKYVLEMVRTRLQEVPKARVTVIQFVDRNTIHGTQGLDNRWLVTVNSDEAKEYLLRHGLSMFNRKIKMRRYDDVLNDEYVEYQHYEQMQHKLFVHRHDEHVTSDPPADQSDDSGGLRVADPHGRPPTTPEPPRTAF